MSPHKHCQVQSSRRRQSRDFLGVQQCPTYFTLVEKSAVMKVPTSRGVGVAWNIQVCQTSNHQHILRETATITIYSGQLMACPNCNCLMQLGAQIEIQSTSTGAVVDLLVKRLDIVRVPTSSRLLRLTQAQDDVCESPTYYILLKVHIGDTVSRETYWKITI